MQLSGNTILITGGGTGIGLGLAQAFHQRGNVVIIAGRRRSMLEQAAAGNPGIDFVELDVTSPESVGLAAEKLTAQYPALNVVINNAGVQRLHEFGGTGGLDEQAAEAEIATNIWGVLRVTDAFLPHLRQVAGTHPSAASIINVTSGLAFVPMSRFPIYCATKAFVHSFTMTLRAQLSSSGVHVLELAPPWVKTDLDADHGESTLHEGMSPMPLDAFIAAAMGELATDEDELKVAGAKYLYAGGISDKLYATFTQINR